MTLIIAKNGYKAAGASQHIAPGEADEMKSQH